MKHRESKENIIAKVTDILKQKKYIGFAYIFGSFSFRGEDSFKQNNFNDIDIGIYISRDKITKPLELELELEHEIENILNFPIDVRIINSAPLSFQYNVIKTGIVIIDTNKTQRSDFEGLTLKKYFDFIRLRNEYLREVQNA